MDITGMNLYFPFSFPHVSFSTAGFGTSLTRHEIWICFVITESILRNVNQDLLQSSTLWFVWRVWVTSVC